MRLKTILLALCLSASAWAWNPIAFTATGQGGGTTKTTAAITTTGADLIVLSITAYNQSGLTLSDSKGNVYTALPWRGGGNRSVALAFCLNPIVGTLHTVTVTVTGAINVGIGVSAWSGAAPASALDAGNTGALGTTANPATVKPGSVTPTVARSLIVTAVSYNNVASVTINLGFTRQLMNATGAGVGFAFLEQSSTAAVDPTWTGSAGSETLGAAIAVFKPAPATPHQGGMILW